MCQLISSPTLVMGVSRRGCQCSGHEVEETSILQDQRTPVQLSQIISCYVLCQDAMKIKVADCDDCKSITVMTGHDAECESVKELEVVELRKEAVT